MNLPKHFLNSATAVLVLLLLVLTGCTTGYQLRVKNGVETLYHTDGSGTRQIVYVVQKDGSLQIHDENDPLVKRIYTDPGVGPVIQEYAGSSLAEDDTRHQQNLAARLIQAGRLQVADKRHASDPIFVTVHAAKAGTTANAEQAQERYRQIIRDELTRDDILALTTESGDVDIFLNSYVRETSAVDLRTKKLVTVKAFYFEALVRSNYLPGESHTICELGHLMDRRMVVKRTAKRVNKVIKEKIGLTIPKDRAKYLPSLSKGV